MRVAGYSAKSLAEKLGIPGRRKPAEPGSEAARKALFVAAPADYAETLGPLPPSLDKTEAGLAQAASAALRKRAPFAFIQAFCRAEDELRPALPALKALLASDGMLWISWPKQSKGRKPAPGDLNEARVRALGLDAGLVDVKVCAVDAIWSGLKFVYRRQDRP
jgi:hypothetical protein